MRRRPLSSFALLFVFSSLPSLVLLSSHFSFLSPSSSPSFLSPLASTQKRCPSPLFRQSRSSFPLNGTPPPHLSTIHFFAITQDCQFVLARPDQLVQLRSLSVAQPTPSSPAVDCTPSRINFLWVLHSSNPSLVLLQQRTPHQLCLLPIEMPQFSLVSADSVALFRYSLRNALHHFAYCHPTNSSLALNPNMAFADPLYSDIFYFLDPSPSRSRGANNASLWTAHQVHLSPSGLIRVRNTFHHRVTPMIKHPSSHQKTFLPADASSQQLLLLVSDAQRKRLFAVQRSQQRPDLDTTAEKPSIRWTCQLDLVYRPHLVRFRPLSLFPRSSASLLMSPGSQLTGFAVDRNVAIFSESVPNSLDSFVFVAKLRAKNNAKLADSHCVLKLPYGAKFGVISEKTLQELRSKGPLPQMEGTMEMPALVAFPATKNAAETMAHDDNQQLSVATAGEDSASAHSSMPPQRGHVISLLKAAQNGPKLDSMTTPTNMVVGHRNEPFWKTTKTTTTTTVPATENKMRLEVDGDGEEEEEASDDNGEWSNNDYEQWRDQPPMEQQQGDGDGEDRDDHVVVPLREQTMGGPAHLREKVGQAAEAAESDKNDVQKAVGQQEAAAAGTVPPPPLILSSVIMPLAVIILFLI